MPCPNGVFGKYTFNKSVCNFKAGKAFNGDLVLPDGLKGRTKKDPQKRKNPRQRSLWPQDQSLGSGPDFLTRVTEISPRYLHKVNRETCQGFFKLPMESGSGGRCSHQTWMLDRFGCVYPSVCLLSEQEGPGPLGECPAHWSGISINEVVSLMVRAVVEWRKRKPGMRQG